MHRPCEIGNAVVRFHLGMPKKKQAPRMLTVREVADRLQVADSSVRIWASKGRFLGAERHETPVGSYWLIPESALDTFERRGVGRPRKNSRGRKTSGNRPAK